MKFFANILASAALIAAVSAPALAASVDEMRVMSQAQLDEVYLNAEAGPMPDGESDGTAVFFPGSLINTPTQMLAALIWQGKVFDTDDSILVNKVFGFRAIKAELYVGESLFDGRESNIIDYSRTSILAHRIRDEVRLVAPGVYLGRAYLRTWLGDYNVVNFVLDFN